eukprot:COSAG06_NODE_9441_length_1901_cov_11.315205_3_plen_105_part_00
MLAITLHSLWACGIAGGPRCLYTAATASAVRVGAPVRRPLALTVGSLRIDSASGRLFAFFLPVASKKKCAKTGLGGAVTQRQPWEAPWAASIGICAAAGPRGRR